MVTPSTELSDELLSECHGVGFSRSSLVEIQDGHAVVNIELPHIVKVSLRRGIASERRDSLRRGALAQNVPCNWTDQELGVHGNLPHRRVSIDFPCEFLLFSWCSPSAAVTRRHPETLDASPR